MASRKRGRDQMEAPESVKEPSLLVKLRNMWEFANLNQWIYIFGRVVKIDEDLDIEDLEMECFKPQSTVLSEIGLALLKFVSSHRGLTLEIFDEYTRRQYVAKAPGRNPFGIEEEPAKFAEFDVFTKIRVLQQLTIWTLGNPDRIRERMEESKDSEQTIWRIEPFGWDSNDRTYFVLDDNRLYRRTDPPPPPAPIAKPKKNSKKAKAAARSSKRRKTAEAIDSEADVVEEPEAENSVLSTPTDDTFGGMKWECIAITLNELTTFISTIERSRDPNEKALSKALQGDLLPLLEKQEETRKRKILQKERELLALEKLATAKRSSRLAGKAELQKQEEEAREAERKKEADLAMARKEQEKWMKLEKERESRMMTREQRVKEREAKRILHEEELANLSEDSKKVESGVGRLSERHLKAEIEKKKQALEELEEEEDWTFDCICGAYGQIDDGTHSIACEKCNIWQHSKCVGVSQAEAERTDFHFVCSTCKRRAEDAERAKTQPPIKIKLSRPGSSSSPNNNGSLANSSQPKAGDARVEKSYPPILPPARQATSSKPPAKSPQDGPSVTKPPGLVSSPASSNGFKDVSPHVSGGTYTSPYAAAAARPTSSHAFSSPHHGSPINLPPPAQPEAYSFVNGSAPNHSKQFKDTHALDSTPAPYNGSKYAPSHASPTPLPGYGHQSTPNGQPHSGALMSNTSNKAILPPYNSPTVAKSPALQSTTVTSPPPTLSPEGPIHQDHVASSVLPPTRTGYSPTKHSPPRPTTSNGSFGSATPSILPPVDSLSPSPRLQNLSPPIKTSELDRNHHTTGQP